MKCKWCKKEVYSTINDKCEDCYYLWEGQDLIIKISVLLLAGLELFIILIILRIIK